jgi:hypothetical protein
MRKLTGALIVLKEDGNIAAGEASGHDAINCLLCKTLGFINTEYRFIFAVHNMSL